MAQVGSWGRQTQEAFRSFLAQVIRSSRKNRTKWLLQAHFIGSLERIDGFGRDWFDFFGSGAIREAVVRPETVPLTPRLSCYEDLLAILGVQGELSELLLEMLESLEVRLGEVAGSKGLVFLYLFFRLFIQFGLNFKELGKLVDLLSVLKRVTEQRREAASDPILAEAYQVQLPVCLGTHRQKPDLRST